MTNFEQFKLHEAIEKNLEKNDISKPTEIQEKVFNVFKNKKDILGLAQTGSGKTLAYSIPILENLINSNVKTKAHHPRAVVLAPTRELVIQVEQIVSNYGEKVNIKCGAIYGSVPYFKQDKILKKQLDIIIATPGRFIDQINRGKIKMKDVEILCLDEADKMLSLGFYEDVKKISSYIEKKVQTFMFSATINKNIKKLIDNILEDYTEIKISSKLNIPKKIVHSVMFVPMKNKKDLLLELLNDKKIDQGIIFTRTKSQADSITKMISKEGFKSDAIHGDKKQNVRQKILSKFKQKKYQFLVATDVMARGIDIESITHVFNYNLPLEEEYYVHRIGRTGRANKSGTAISFCDQGDIPILQDIEKVLNIKIEITEKAPFTEVFKIPEKTNRKRNFGRKPFRKDKRKSFDDKRPYGKKRSFKGDDGGDSRERNSRGDKRPYDKKRSFKGDDGGDSKKDSRKRSFRDDKKKA